MIRQDEENDCLLELPDHVRIADVININCLESFHKNKHVEGEASGNSFQSGEIDATHQGKILNEDTPERDKERRESEHESSHFFGRDFLSRSMILNFLIPSHIFDTFWFYITSSYWHKQYGIRHYSYEVLCYMNWI